MTKRFLPSIARFARDNRGSVTVEAVLILPLLLWAYVATFVFFDAFKTQNTNLKAAYTIADMVTRQAEVDAAYVEGLHVVYDYLIATGEDTSLRVSSVLWNDVDGNYEVIWSYATGGDPVMTTASIVDFEDQLPMMPVGDTVIVVETTLDYTPTFDVGILSRSFTQFIVTRPRFQSDVDWVSLVTGWAGRWVA